MFNNYFRIALRNLKINRTYAILNVFGLSLGITGALLIFIFLHYHLSTDRHQPDFDRIYKLVLDLHLDEGIEHEQGSSYAMATALSRDYSQIEKVGFIGKKEDVTLSAASDGNVKRFIEREGVAYADQGYMQMFAFDWLESSGSDVMTEPFTVVINEKSALKYFGTVDVLGKTLRLDNASDLRIVGVIKNQVHPTDLNFNIYISLPTLKKLDTSHWTDDFGWTSSKNFTFIKISDGSNPNEIQRSIKANKTKNFGANAKYYEHKLQPLADVHFDERYGGQIRWSILWILAGVGFFLLIIATINFINLSTALALKRAKEMGIRKVLGSTQSQLFWQFMTETALVTMGSAVIALMLTAVLLPVLNHWSHTQAFDLHMLFQLPVAAFLFVAIATVILFAGFYPAIIISGFDPIAALKSKPCTQQVGGIGLRRSLITVQLIIAQILVIGTLVLVLQLKFFKMQNLVLIRMP